MRTIAKYAGLAASAMLVVGMTACSSSGGGGSTSPSASSPKPVGAFTTLTGNATSVKLNAGFAKALATLKVTPGIIGKAKLDATTGTVSFPITSGHVTVYKKGAVTPYVQGEIDHEGSGLSLAAGGTKVMLENFVIDPGNNSKLTGEVIAGGKTLQGVKLFDLDGNTLQTPTISKAGVATLTGTTVYLSTAAAGLLNKTFGITALKGGTKTGTEIGVATIRATGTT